MVLEFKPRQSGSGIHFPDNYSGLTLLPSLAFIPNDRLCVRIVSSWPTSDFHVPVSHTVPHMLVMSHLKGKPGLCHSFLPWVFSKGAETAQFSSTYSQEVGEFTVPGEYSTWRWELENECHPHPSERQSSVSLGTAPQRVSGRIEPHCLQQ